MHACKDKLSVPRPYERRREPYVSIAGLLWCTQHTLGLVPVALLNITSWQAPGNVEWQARASERTSKCEVDSVLTFNTHSPRTCWAEFE